MVCIIWMCSDDIQQRFMLERVGRLLLFMSGYMQYVCAVMIYQIDGYLTSRYLVMTCIISYCRVMIFYESVCLNELADYFY